jgi:hypothetical protein
MDHWIGEWVLYQLDEVLTMASVIATGRSLVREIAALPDDMMSFMDAINEVNHWLFVFIQA